jgi:hypothetical protein
MNKPDYHGYATLGAPANAAPTVAYAPVALAHLHLVAHLA